MFLICELFLVEETKRTSTSSDVGGAGGVVGSSAVDDKIG